jgi:hypothetical protein
MPFLTASALNDNAEGLDFLRAVLSASRSQRHSPRAPSWTPSTAYLGGEVACGTGSAKPRISRRPLIHGVIIPLPAAYTPVAKQCPF